MKTRSILNIFAIVAVMLMAFSFVPSTKEDSVTVKDNTEESLIAVKNAASNSTEPPVKAAVPKTTVKNELVEQIKSLKIGSIISLQDSNGKVTQQVITRKLKDQMLKGLNMESDCMVTYCDEKTGITWCCYYTGTGSWCVQMSD